MGRWPVGEKPGNRNNPRLALHRNNRYGRARLPLSRRFPA
jgi:hypothetical protein